MSDIHIGKSVEKNNNKREVTFYMHIPLSKPLSGVIPTPKSSIESQLDQTDKDALGIGEMVEKSQTIVLGEGKNITDSDITAKLKNVFSSRKKEVNDKFNFEYKDFGTKIDATA